MVTYASDKFWYSRDRPSTRPRYCREGELRRPAETAQKGLETKWEGLVTILSLVSNFLKKVIPQKSFGRPSFAPQAYHCKITQSTGVAAQMQVEV